MIAQSKIANPKSRIARPHYGRVLWTFLRNSLIREMAFRDHHWFSAGDIEMIERAASEAGADLIVTTEKDSVRLDKVRAAWAVLPLTMKIEPEDVFAVWLEARVRLARAQQGSAA